MKTIRLPLFLSVFTATSIGIATVNAADTLYVGSQISTTPINKYDSLGTSNFFAPQDGSPLRHLAFDTSGNLFVAYQNVHTIWKYAPSGAGTVFASAGSGLVAPYGLAFDDVGNLFVANRGADSILKFAPDGTGSMFVNSGLFGPMSLAFHDGNLFVVNLSGSILKFDSMGNPAAFAQLESSIYGGLVFDHSGNMFAASRNYVYKITPYAAVSIFLDFTSSFPMPSTHGLAIDSEDNLFVSDLTDTIWKVTPDGVMTVFANQPAPSFMVVVPEPSTTVLLVTGVLALAWRRRRDR